MVIDPSAMPDLQRLKARLIRRFLSVHWRLAVALFIAAGSFRFWQAWAYIGLSLILHLWFILYFYVRNPKTLERRMLIREKNSGQKVIIVLLWLVIGSTLVLAGLDFRFGWTRANFFPIPIWLTALALMVIAGSQWLYVKTLKTNSFAASIIQVETGQTIAATGPYRFVRHPMYLGMTIHWLATPLALGSIVALAASVFVIPVFILRLIDEERILRRDLPGYAEYCRQTRRRLVPFVW